MLYRQVQVCCCTSVYAFGVQVSGFSVQESVGLLLYRCGFVAVQVSVGLLLYRCVWVCCCTGKCGFVYR